MRPARRAEAAAAAAARGAAQRRGVVTVRPAVVRHSARHTVHIPDASFPRFILDHQHQHGDREAMHDVTTGESVSHQQLIDRVLRAATGLAKMGFKKGDVAMANMPNKLEYPVAMLAVQLLGGIFSPCGPQFNEKELYKQFRDAEAKWVFTDATVNIRGAGGAAGGSVAPAAQAAAWDAGIRREHVFAVGEASYADLLAHDAAPPTVHMDPNEVTMMPYSSGTTGAPKGVMLTHRNLIANCVQMCDVLGGDGQGETWFAVLPFFHIYPHILYLNYGLAAGVRSAVLPKFDFGLFLKGLAEQKVTTSHVAPPIATMLATQPEVDDYDLSSLKVICSAAACLGTEIEGILEQRLGVTVVQAWGMSELSPIATWIPREHWGRKDLQGTVGASVANTDVRIVDPQTGDDVEPGVDERGVPRAGEIWIRGPQVMKGYFNRPKETADIIDNDGFLHTGDIAKVNDEGFVWVVDRIKNLIKYKGHQVSPGELEDVLKGHDDIDDAAVIPSVRASDGEEIPLAYVVRRAGSAVSADDVMAYVAAKVAPFKKVRAVKFVAAIPKVPSGKILHRVLVEEDRAERAAAGAAAA